MSASSEAARQHDEALDLSGIDLVECERDRYKDLCGELLKACEHAAQFIENGVEYGYIRMPDLDTPDSAHSTLPMLHAVITKVKAG